MTVLSSIVLVAVLTQAPPDGLSMQVALDRAGFSPGVIDGHVGSSTKKALDAYRKQHGSAPACAEPDDAISHHAGGHGRAIRGEDPFGASRSGEAHEPVVQERTDGTPEPSMVARTQSHGCVRLTNWDALKLAGFAKPGTRVAFRQ